jgi:hypothetical protein
MRRSYVVPMRWIVIYEYEVPGGALSLSYTKQPRPWAPWKSSPSRKNPHERTGNRTRDLMISSQKLWPLDHEAGQRRIIMSISYCKGQHVKIGKVAVKTARTGGSDQINLRRDHHFISFSSYRLPFATTKMKTVRFSVPCVICLSVNINTSRTASCVYCFRRVRKISKSD